MRSFVPAARFSRPSFAKPRRSRVGKGAKRRAHVFLLSFIRVGFARAQPTLQSASSKTGKRSAERRIVQPMSASSAAACRAARRLSALTLAALATGYYPDGSAPEPGFPRRPLTGVSPVSPTEKKNMPRLSTLRADRSLCRSTGDPEPPGCGLAKRSARGHRTSHSLSRHAVRNGALHKAR